MQKTLLIIKPDSFANRHLGDILKRIEEEDFEIVRMRSEVLSRARAEAFYSEHKGKPFFELLVNFMISGPSLAVELAHPDAVTRLRALNGNTAPEKAAPGTLRALYGKGGPANAVHGSDSPESAARELAFFFPETT